MTSNARQCATFCHHCGTGGTDGPGSKEKCAHESVFHTLDEKDSKLKKSKTGLFSLTNTHAVTENIR